MVVSLFRVIVCVILFFESIPVFAVNPLLTRLYSSISLQATLSQPAYSTKGYRYINANKYSSQCLKPLGHRVASGTGIPGVKIHLRHHINRLVIGGGISFDRGSLNGREELSSYSSVDSNIHVGWLANIFHGLLETFTELGFRSMSQFSIPAIINRRDREGKRIYHYNDVSAYYYFLSGVTLSTMISKHLMSQLSLAIGKAIQSSVKTDLPVWYDDRKLYFVFNHIRVSPLIYAKAQLNYRIKTHVSMGLSMAYKAFSYKRSQIRMIERCPGYLSGIGLALSILYG